MNVHLTEEFNLSLFHGLVQELKLDIVAVVETWFFPNTSFNLITLYFNKDKFEWFSRERQDQCSNTGSGGIGILVRKLGYHVYLIKQYDSFEGLWIHYRIGNNL